MLVRTPKKLKANNPKAVDGSGIEEVVVVGMVTVGARLTLRKLGSIPYLKSYPLVTSFLTIPKLLLGKSFGINELEYS